MPTLTVRDILAGTPSTVQATSLTVGEISAAGPETITIELTADRTSVGPGETATLTATGPAGATYEWRRVSGPAVTLVDSGATVALTGPSTMPPTQGLVIGCRAVVGTQVSREATLTLTVLPQTDWAFDGTRGSDPPPHPPPDPDLDHDAPTFGWGRFVVPGQRFFTEQTQVIGVPLGR
ncbi:MAG: hypothetical protein FWD18_00495 [Micrococcales bacterium]|nr:hypothetical protein [Micrococcales bacterium]